MRCKQRIAELRAKVDEALAWKDRPRFLPDPAGEAADLAAWDEAMFRLLFYQMRGEELTKQQEARVNRRIAEKAKAKARSRQAAARAGRK